MIKKRISVICFVFVLGCTPKTETTSSSIKESVYGFAIASNQLIVEQKESVFESNQQMLMLGYDKELLDTLQNIRHIEKQIDFALEQIKSQGDKNEQLANTLDTLGEFIKNSFNNLNLDAKLPDALPEVNSTKKEQYANFLFRKNTVFLEAYNAITLAIFKVMARRSPPPPIN